MPARARWALVVYVVVGLALAGSWWALPDWRAWQPEDTRYIQELRRLGERVAAETFPAWRMGEMPVLLTKGPVNYLVDLADGPSGRAVPEAGGGLAVRRLDRPLVPVLAAGPYRVGEAGVILVPSKPALDNGFAAMQQQAYAAGGEAGVLSGLLGLGAEPLPPEEFTAVLLHEALHVHQMPLLEAAVRRFEAMGLEQEELWELYRDERNSELQSREAALLFGALLAASEEEARALGREFLAARAERWAYWEGKLGAERAGAIREVERFMEWAEGLARYVELRAWEVGAAHASESLLAGEPGYTGYRGDQTWGYAALRKQIGEPLPPDGNRERVYRFGAGQALLLDRIGVNWRDRADQGVDPERLLAEVLRECGR